MGILDGIIGNAIVGAGAVAQQTLTQQNKIEEAQALADMQQKMEIAREQRLAEAKKQERADSAAAVQQATRQAQTDASDAQYQKVRNIVESAQYKNDADRQATISAYDQNADQIKGSILASNTNPDQLSVARNLLAQGRTAEAANQIALGDAELRKQEADARGEQRESDNAFRDKDFAFRQKHADDQLKIARASLSLQVKNQELTQRDADLAFKLKKDQYDALEGVISTQKNPNATPQERQQAYDLYMTTLAKLPSTHEQRQNLSAMVTAANKIANDTTQDQDMRDDAKATAKIAMRMFRSLPGGDETKDKAGASEGVKTDSAAPDLSGGAPPGKSDKPGMPPPRPMYISPDADGLSSAESARIRARMDELASSVKANPADQATAAKFIKTYGPDAYQRQFSPTTSRAIQALYAAPEQAPDFVAKFGLLAYNAAMAAKPRK